MRGVERTGRTPSALPSFTSSSYPNTVASLPRQHRRPRDSLGCSQFAARRNEAGHASSAGGKKPRASTAQTLSPSKRAPCANQREKTCAHKTAPETPAFHSHGVNPFPLALQGASGGCTVSCPVPARGSRQHPSCGSASHCNTEWGCVGNRCQDIHKESRLRENFSDSWTSSTTSLRG